MDTKKLVVQRTMTPQCALQMRSTFGTDVLIQETGLFEDGKKIQHTSEQDEGRGSEGRISMQTL